MTTIAEMYNNWKRVNLRKQVPIIIEQNKQELIDLNQSQVYQSSEDSFGEPLRFYSSNSYAFEKEKQNAAPGFGRPDLYLTGAFYRAFVVKVSPRFYEINSKDTKTKKLKSKYGEDIFGLTDENKGKFANETLFVGIRSYIESTTGVKFG